MEEKKRIPLLLKTVIIVSCFLLAADAFLGVFLMVASTNRMKSLVRNKMIEIACTAAELVDGDKIAALTVEDEQNKTEDYVTYYNILNAFKTSAENNNADLAFIYCLIKLDDGRIVFSIDPSDDPGVFLQEETTYTDGLLKAYETGKPTFDTASYEDRWGNLYSAYAPVFGSDGNIAIMIGVDVWAKWYQQEIVKSTITIGALTTVTLLLGVGISIIITSKMRKKFLQLSADMSSLEDDVQKLIKDISDPRYVKNIDENNAGGDTLDVLKNKIYSTQAEIKNYIAYINAQAYIDSLTRLGNRTAYYEKVKEITPKLLNGEIDLRLVIFDINGLKEINDTHGHEYGDKAIHYTGRIIKQLFGEKNSFRMGGDELVIFIFDLDDEGLAAKLKDFESKLNELNRTKSLPFELSASYGKAHYSSETDNSYMSVFRRADKEMYAYKARYYKDKGSQKLD